MPPALFAVAFIVAACGPSQREILSRDLTDQLVAAGIIATEVEVWPPQGAVPHWNVYLRVDGGESDARAACAAVVRLAIYDGRPPYLVRVMHGPTGVLECGWARETPASSPSPAGPSGTP